MTEHVRDNIVIFNSQTSDKHKVIENK